MNVLTELIATSLLRMVAQILIELRLPVGQQVWPLHAVGEMKVIPEFVQSPSK